MLKIYYQRQMLSTASGKKNNIHSENNTKPGNVKKTWRIIIKALAESFKVMKLYYTVLGLWHNLIFIADSLSNQTIKIL